jgi:WXXGXW repeat (2 copies)
MAKRIDTVALALLLAGLLAGCVVTPYAPEPVDAVQEQASEPPPPLPVYEQPPCPEEGYVWTPGLWRWGPEGYYWVPGTWVAPPQVGVLWTPGYWALAGAVYVFHAGYWGPHVGYYGGINYGGGYNGYGYAGGRWRGNRFEYNTAVTNVNTTIVRNTYHETVINQVHETNVTRVSYVGAPGTRPQPNRTEANSTHEAHQTYTQPQIAHHDAARTSPMQNAARNEGRPPVAATPRAAAFSAPGVTAAKPVGPTYHPQHPQGHEERPEH